MNRQPYNMATDELNLKSISQAFELIPSNFQDPSIDYNHIRKTIKKL